MILYHGSFLAIEQPDLRHSRPNVDFGRGFYVTPLYEQAGKWCEKFKRRGKDGIISRYEYDEGREEELKILKFDSYSEKWLDFILNCRSGNDTTDSRLRYEKPNRQICFRTEKALSLLHFEGSEKI